LGLAKIGPAQARQNGIFNINAAPPVATTATPASASPAGLQKVPRPLVVATVLLAAGAIADLAVPERHEVPPARADFAEFPTRVGDWVGQRGTLDRIYLDALHLDDYMLADYHNQAGLPLNFYVAYYQSQRSGHRVHSPINCIPGGGWTIRKSEQRLLPASEAGGSRPVAVNRLIIELGTQQSLVYYWFQERGRVLTDETVVKWYIFWDAFTRNRTDGALVRLVVPITPGAKEADIDAAMQRFVASVQPGLNRYVPD
jgi:EpsI family protein